MWWLHHYTQLIHYIWYLIRYISQRSWRDFACECFCFGCEAVNGSGEAVGGLVKSRVELAPAQIRRVF